MPKPHPFEKHASICRQLGDKSRLALLRQLKGKKLSVKELSEKLESKPQQVRNQLNALSEAGLCKLEKEESTALHSVWSTPNPQVHALLEEASRKATEIGRYDSEEIFRRLSIPQVIELLKETGKREVSSKQANEILVGQTHHLQRLALMRIISKSKAQARTGQCNLYFGNALKKVMERLDTLAQSS